MKREYESPELEIVTLTLSADVLGISDPEITTSSGFIEEPDDELLD